MTGLLYFLPGREAYRKSYRNPCVAQGLMTTIPDNQKDIKLKKTL